MEDVDHTVVILGASDQSERYSNMAMKLLMRHGYRVIPVHPKLNEIIIFYWKYRRKIVL